MTVREEYKIESAGRERHKGEGTMVYILLGLLGQRSSRLDWLPFKPDQALCKPYHFLRWSLNLAQGSNLQECTKWGTTNSFWIDTADCRRIVDKGTSFDKEE
jgi:hypothetical protein